MKIKIVSDGTPDGTKVLDTDTNSVLEYVTSVQIYIDPFMTRANIAVCNPQLDISNLEIEKK